MISDFMLECTYHWRELIKQFMLLPPDSIINLDCPECDKNFNYFFRVISFFYDVPDQEFMIAMKHKFFVCLSRFVCVCWSVDIRQSKQRSE